MKRKIISVLMTSVLVASTLVSGCAQKEPVSGGTATGEGGTSAASAGEAATPVIEWWYVDEIGKGAPVEGKIYNFFKEQTGVAYTSPAVLWDGGTGYYNKLQLRIASKELPDMFTPLKGLEISLARDGMLAELGDYIETYAPNYYQTVSEETWANIAAMDPHGQGGIYFLPDSKDYYDYGTFIRKDWLDKLGLQVPTTQEELVEVLRAFRDDDPNGNGMKDEVPMIGREYGRWMDYLFHMYGVSMIEGYPQFDLTDGELTYSGVTQNMRDAIAFAASLYEEGLLDPDTFLNSANDLWAKIGTDKTGCWYHIPRGTKDLVLDKLKVVAPDAELIILPDINAPGYTASGSVKLILPQYCIAARDEQTIINCLTLLDWFYDPANLDQVIWGIPGVTYTEENGVRTPVQKESWEEMTAPAHVLPTLNYQLRTMELKAETVDASELVMFDTVVELLHDSQNASWHVIASDGMPESVYEGYADIQSHKMYQEYMSKIILGTYPIEKFDEFVELWYQSGGQEVTDRARAWYEDKTR